jgi:TrmH family RNA methyltransferase
MSRPFITSSSNPRLKAVRRLRRAPHRIGDGVFLVEGHRQVAAALEAGAAVRELLVAPELFLGDTDAELARLAEQRGTDVLELSAGAYALIAGNARRDGIVAVVERWAVTLDSLEIGPNPLLLVAERVERPGNLGTIIRAACAAGADALIACGGGSDPFHPEAVRGSVGTLFKLPLARCACADAIPWLRDRNVRVVVATPDADRPHWATTYSGPTAIVVGNERYGVSDAWLDAADELVQIPMPGPADSLNVAVAAGIVLFEAARQRTEPQSSSIRSRSAAFTKSSR